MLIHIVYHSDSVIEVDVAIHSYRGQAEEQTLRWKQIFLWDGKVWFFRRLHRSLHFLPW